MRARTWASGLLALSGLCFGPSAGRAADTVKLVLPARDDVPAVALGKTDIGADTIDARYGVRVGAYRGGSYRGGFGGGFHYAGYRYGSFYRYGDRYGAFYRYPRYNYGGYPYYASSYYYPYYYPSSAYYYTPAPFYCPISAAAVPLMPPADGYNLPPAQETLPPPAPVPPGGTFPYDGGPRVPMPMPGVEPAPFGVPPRGVTPTVPLDGRPVSLQVRSTTAPKWTYPAYGELPRPSSIAEYRVVPVGK